MSFRKPLPHFPRVHLVLEELEPRQLLSGYQPTAMEQLFLEQLNDARSNPAAYGASIGVDLSGVAPSRPLAFNTLLVQTARDHSVDMNVNNYFSHNSLSGVNPGQRMSAVGFPWTSYGESIAAGYSSASSALAGLITDSGVPDLGHRRMLLSMDSIYQNQFQVGVGIVQNGTGQWTNYYTVDSASTSDPRAFVTGVVFNDANGNGKYDVGEGLGNVTLSVNGNPLTTSFGSGGYDVQLSPGTYTITASGGGLAAPITQTVTIGTSNVRLNFNAAAAPVQPPSPPPLSSFSKLGDFDGDGKADLAVWRPSNGTWYILFSSTNFASGITRQWGLPGDIPIKGSDFDGDGKADLVVWRPSKGTWYILTSSSGYTQSLTIQWGLPGDMPINHADFDGDHRADLAVWRPSNGTWYVLTSSSGYNPAQAMTVQWGLPGDIPRSGDFDGDGRTDMAVWRPSTGTWYVLLSSSNFSTYQMTQWGLPGDVPIANSDFDKDGKADLVVWRPSTGTWYILTSSSGYTVSLTRQWGLSGDTPVMGNDFSNNGVTDFVIWRPREGKWYIQDTATGAQRSYSYGWYGDIPV